MKHFRKSIIFGLAIALMLVAAVPALASDTVKVTLVNRTGSSVNVKLNGPDDTQNVFVPKDANLVVKLVPDGAYTYGYEACGHTFRGSFTASVGKTVTLKKCGGVTMVTISVNNQTGNPFIVSLTGNGHVYGFWIPAHGTNISVLAGGYSFTSNACGSPSGIIRASARAAQPLIWTWTCKGPHAGATLNSQ